MLRAYGQDTYSTWAFLGAYSFSQPVLCRPGPHFMFHGSVEAVRWLTSKYKVTHIPSAFSPDSFPNPQHVRLVKSKALSLVIFLSFLEATALLRKHHFRPLHLTLSEVTTCLVDCSCHAVLDWMLLNRRRFLFLLRVAYEPVDGRVLHSSSLNFPLEDAESLRRRSPQIH